MSDTAEIDELVSKKRAEQNRTNVKAFRENLAEKTGRKQRTYFTDDEDLENMKAIKAALPEVSNQSDAIKYALAKAVNDLKTR